MAIRRIVLRGGSCDNGTMMIRRMHIYMAFGTLVAGVTIAILLLLAGAVDNDGLSSTLLAVIGSASVLTTGFSAALFFAAWKVRNAPD